jgi:hypothetical protein
LSYFQKLAETWLTKDPLIRGSFFYSFGTFLTFSLI